MVERSHSIVCIGGTDGGVYYCTNFTVYYRNNNMEDWEITANGLPTFFSSNIAKPFYRDGKLRIASYGKGIWETELEEAPTTIIPQAMVDKLDVEVICNVDSFYFDDFSMVNHNGISWQWEFPDGSPSISNLRNPTTFDSEEIILLL
ncbi:MAG: hypothetical protein R2771_08160 [Saprospiraceae bacterium]